MNAPQSPAPGAAVPDAAGHFGPYGGRYVAETLMPAVLELEAAYRRIAPDPRFRSELARLLRDYAGRPTPLFLAERLTAQLGGAKIYLKREDLNHTGSHKINNTLGQALLARRMGKTQGDRRDRRRPARRGHGHGGGALRDGVPDLHGGGGHPPPGPQRPPDADPRRRGGPGRRRARRRSRTP